MSFYAANFVYDGIISSEYGLRITSLMGEEETNAGADVELLTQSLYRRPKTYLLGVQQTPVLTIPVKINTQTQLSANEDSVISNWLFGSLTYKKLQILQSDMQYVYYNCILNNKQVVRVGNVVRGYTADIVCDSPFAWEYPRSASFVYNPPGYARYFSTIINNTSDNADYTYPTVTFETNVFGGYLSIINTSDNNRQFYFSDLPANETIIVDNDLQTISASPSGANYLPNFVHYDAYGTMLDSSYNWLRYIKGENNLSILGNIKSIKFEHQCARKMS